MMENESKRKKSISLLLIIFIIILVAALVILLVRIFKDNSDEEEISNATENSSAQLSITTNTSNYNDIEDISEFNEISDSNNVEDVNNVSTEITNTSSNDENNTVAENTTSSEENSLTLNNHTFKFDNSADASIIQDSGRSVIQATYSSSNYKLLLNPDNTSSFDDLKNNSDLKTYLESNYNLSITNNLKSGTLVNLDVIIFTISNGSNTAYCIITPLSDSEVLFAQIYNTADMTTLVDNTILAESLSEISNIISNSQN